MDVNESDQSPNKPRPASDVVETNNDGTGRHVSKSKSSWGLSTAVHSVGFVAKKVVNNRLTDSLWHSRKGGSSASEPSHEPVDDDDDHATKPLPTLADGETAKLPEREKNPYEISKNLDGSAGNQHQGSSAADVIDEFENLKPQDCSHVSTTGPDLIDRSDGMKRVKAVNQHRWPSRSGSHFVDQSGSLKARDGSHVKLVQQHRWPGRTSSHAVDQSDNIKSRDGSHARLVNQHRWPGTVGSNVLNKGIKQPDEAIKLAPNLRKTSLPNYASKPAQDSSSDATSISSLSHVSDGRLKIDDSLQAQPSSPKKVSPASPPHDFHTPMPSSSPKESSNSDTVSISTESGHSPNKETGHTLARDVSPGPSDGTTSPTYIATAVSSPTSVSGVSPPLTKGFSHRVRGVIPSLTKPSSTKHFFKSNVLSIFSKITDVRKEKNASNQIDDSKYLELLHNIQLQWQFANVNAEAAFDLRRVTAEKSLLDAWRTILELRDSIAAKKVDSVLLILQLKLYAVLRRQMAFIDEWASIQKEYDYALSVTTNDLQARNLSVPITGGVKADIKDLKLVVFSTVQVLQATASRIHATLSKLDKTHFLASELANVSLHERALIDECEIFLASTVPLQIEECSLRSYLIQSSRTSISEP